jgi:hypothetical protein
MALFSDQLFGNEEQDFYSFCFVFLLQIGWPEKRWRLASKPFACRN